MNNSQSLPHRAPRNSGKPPLGLLLVDDSPVMTSMVPRFLAEFGSGRITLAGAANTGSEALAMAASLKPDVAVVDLNLPDISGFDLIARLRELLPQVWIVVLTMSDTNPTRVAAETAGANEFVYKANLSAELLPAVLRKPEARPSPPGHGHKTR